MRDVRYWIRLGAAAALLALGGAIAAPAVAFAQDDGDGTQGIERADGSTGRRTLSASSAS